MIDSRFSDYVYLDWAATAPLSEAAARAVAPYMIAGQPNIAVGANANSLHGPGRAAFAALEDARRSLARSLGANRPSEIIFTSGSTEANNMALLGIVEAVRAKSNMSQSLKASQTSQALQASHTSQARAKNPLVITSTIEHDAILEPLHRLARSDIQLIELAPTRQGFVDPATLQEALMSSQDAQPLLVSIQMANSEVGSIQPIKELVQIAHEAGAYFHTDATQALGKMPVNCNELGVDAASFSAHKIGGPKGVGALYLRARTPFQALLLGGGQEDGRRSTTQNVCGAVGFAASCDSTVSDIPEETSRERDLRDWLYGTLTEIPGVQPVVQPPVGSMDYLPNIVTVMVEGIESETLILRLDDAGFGVSGGSACASHSLRASHVLRALGINSDIALGELRISFGKLTTKTDLERFVEAFKDCL